MVEYPEDKTKIGGISILLTGNGLFASWPIILYVL